MKMGIVRLILQLAFKGSQTVTELDHLLCGDLHSLVIASFFKRAGQVVGILQVVLDQGQGALGSGDERIGRILIFV